MSSRSQPVTAILFPPYVSHNSIATLCPIIIIPTAADTVPKLKHFSIDSTTATSITLRWSVSSDSLVDSYVVMWEESNSAASVTVTITDPSVTTYTLMGLESETTYSITVTASNAVGSTISHPYLYLRLKVYIVENALQYVSISNLRLYRREYCSCQSSYSGWSVGDTTDSECDCFRDNYCDLLTEES